MKVDRKDDTDHSDLPTTISKGSAPAHDVQEPPAVNKADNSTGPAKFDRKPETPRDSPQQALEPVQTAQPEAQPVAKSVLDVAQDLPTKRDTDTRPPGPMPGADVVASVRRSGPVSRVTLTEKWSVEMDTGNGAFLRAGPHNLLVLPRWWSNRSKGGLTAIDKETGRIMWKKPLVQAAFPHNDVVVAWRPFQVLDAQTGKQLWTRKNVVNYMAVSATDDVLAFVSRERDPLRYRLTVVELKTGRELFQSEATETSMDWIESKFELSYDSHGLWVAGRLLPEDREERSAAWIEVVKDAYSGKKRYPEHTVYGETHVLTRDNHGAVQLWDRSQPIQPVWTFAREDLGLGRENSALILHEDHVYSAHYTYKLDTTEHVMRSTDYRLLRRHAPSDGSVLWEVDGIGKSCRILPATFGLLFACNPEPAQNSSGPTTPRALSHEGKVVEVLGTPLFNATIDDDVIYADQSGRIVRLELTTEP